MNADSINIIRKLHGRTHERRIEIEKRLANKMRRYRNALEKKRLKQEQFTIISNTCSGGVICHDLGLRFQSPTVNIYIRPADFVQFCEHLNEYLSLPLIEVPYDNSIGYPVAMLGDITLYCKHYASFAEAKEAWNKRKERIDWKHIYFMMTDRDFVPPVSVNKTIKACDEDIIRRSNDQPYQWMVCIVQNPVYVKKYSSCRQLLRGCEGDCVGIITDLAGISGKRMYQFVKDFDYIQFING